MKQNLGQNTITGNLVADPQWSRHGKVVEFTLAENSRYQDRETQEWKDGPTTYHDVKVRNEHLAGHCLESLKKGQRATATGGHQVEAYVSKDGSPRLSNTLWATDVAGSLRYEARPAVHSPETSGAEVSGEQVERGPGAPAAEPEAQQPSSEVRMEQATEWQQLANDTADRFRGSQDPQSSGPQM